MTHDVENSNERTDLLRGAKKIGAKLGELGWGKGTADDAYYAYKTGAWPISKLGKSLIASDAGLTRHVKKITAAE
jgi:hypothetical protein